ncbi:lysophospholipase L1-like esterase [Pelomonas saccharophila]|uniref:Lysophospholipase L1-like esterase n=1 Tax=Roseateles saccharophilus TaxID=304 RepID=A0ABU1YKU3_ROSSA|nr:SGNH/GDSL hydrolase family protein [Roseateles saccharophilus]MDR7269483.1 lysophospholipase L1-like esterase [Roseateles saccharophilus]
MSKSLMAGLLAVALVLAGCASAPPGNGPWLAAWGSAQLEQAPVANAATIWRQPMRDVSLRQIVRMDATGPVLRVRISNLFGAEPLTLSAVSVALVDGMTVNAASLRSLSFGGLRGVVVPARAEIWSDALELTVPRQADIAVQMHVQAGPTMATVHPGSRIRSWAVDGNRVGLADWPEAVAQEGWWHLAAVDVRAAKPLPVLVATGDSITDGYGVPSGSYQRWTDMLSRRLDAQGREASVVNTGIGGGRLLRDGLGPNLVSRFDRDVLERSGVTHAVVLIGVNDFGVSHRGKPTTPESRAALLAELKAGFADLAQRARARGVCLIASTVMPYSGSGYYAPQAENEADRQALNAWLREPGRFDALVDFDALMRDPARPAFLRAEVDNDGLHPSLAGYRAMAEAFPVEVLERRCVNAP